MATNSFDEDEVPPLDDCSELVEQIKSTNLGCHATTGVAHHGDQGSGKTRENQRDEISNESNRKPENEKKTCPTNEQSQAFCGFQKGFLNKQPPKTQQKRSSNTPKNITTISTKDEEMPTIRAKDPTGSNDLKIPEVQEAMKPLPSLLQDNAWVTDDLLEKFKDRPDLLKKLLDPKYSQAFSCLASNPQKAFEMLNGDKELQDVMTEFSAILGDHFSAMADQTQSDEKIAAAKTGTSKEEEQISNILSNPEVVNAMKDPWICKLINNLKTNCPEANRMLATMRPEYLSKVHKLVKAGVLTFG